MASDIDETAGQRFNDIVLSLFARHEITALAVVDHRLSCGRRMAMTGLPTARVSSTQRACPELSHQNAGVRLLEDRSDAFGVREATANRDVLDWGELIEARVSLVPT